LTVQYVGGEILLIPQHEFQQNVYIAREIFSSYFSEIIDGVQSNLIASSRRVLSLDTLFNGRVGTSVDGRGTQRTVKGSPDAYRKIAHGNMQLLKTRRHRHPGAIFVVDNQGIGNLPFEMKEASDKGYSLVLRPVFQGGSAIQASSLDELVAAFEDAFDDWFMKSRVSVEPFSHLLSKRLFSSNVIGAVCPFQRNCSDVSLNLEPDGTLYTCLDMADAGQEPLGNALSGVFDREAWQRLSKRTEEIDPKCRSCPFFAACQGGCMSEAIHHTGSIYGRSEFCAVWTALFHRIDRGAATYGLEAIGKWMKGLDQC
jgi:radical SAM protein with 4Fe4S-binding SPASM domain